MPGFPSSGFYQNLPSYQQMHGFPGNHMYVLGFPGYPMQDPQSDSANHKLKQVVGSRIPSHTLRDEHKAGALTRLKKTERAYSDTRRYDMRVESPMTDRVKSRRSVDVLKREKLDT
ncbi:hypothetical protein Tco_0375984, partial [Tanacetum coccineum]